jgi:hypothetical protein
VLGAIELYLIERVDAERGAELGVPDRLPQAKRRHRRQPNSDLARAPLPQDGGQAKSAHPSMSRGRFPDRRLADEIAELTWQTKAPSPTEGEVRKPFSLTHCFKLELEAFA